jgi:Protein of unknown function (DUF1524)
MYALHARTLLAGTDLNARLKVLTELKNKLKAKAPAYAEFEPYFLNLRFSRSFTKQKKLIHYILAKIDRAMNNNGLVIDYSQMTIEHLAPENPAGAATVSDANVGSIGNLLLVEKGFNSNNLANKSFTAKKALLQQSKVFMNPIIENATKWTDTEVTERAKWLATNAIQKVWKL